VCALNDFSIKPFSHKFHKIKIPDEFKNSEIIFETHSKVKAIEGVTVGQNEIELILINDSPHTKIVRKHTILGKLRNCEIVTSIENNEEFVNFMYNELNFESINTIDTRYDENSKPWKPSKIIEFKNTSLTTEQIEKLKNLVDKYWKCFSKNDEDIGMVADIYGQHDIELSDEKPIKQRPYVIPYAKEQVVKECVEKILKMDIIEPSNSNWASPIVLVKKPDGSERFCVDYRKVNAVTIKDSFPMPNIENRLNKLHGSRFFTSLDCISGYWQIKLTERAKLISAFICSLGLFSFKVMPFGLCNAGATFQRIMEIMLNKLTNSLAYIDDILTFSKTFEEHLKHLEILFEKLLETNIKVKTSKCKIARKSTMFLGYKISEKGIEIDESRIKVIKTHPKPKTQKHIKQFLG
jgi:hypothetical protein